MNTPAALPHDYRDQMQRMARAYLVNHQAEHLGDNDQLIERTTQHLVHGLDVPLFLAPRLVALAASELPALQPYQAAWLGWDIAAGADWTAGDRHPL